MASFDALNASSGELEQWFKEVDPEDPNIEVHFTPQQLAKMSEYEKNRLRNIKRNYIVMTALGMYIVWYWDLFVFLDTRIVCLVFGGKI